MTDQERRELAAAVLWACGAITALVIVVVWLKGWL